MWLLLGNFLRSSRRVPIAVARSDRAQHNAHSANRMPTSKVDSSQELGFSLLYGC